mgnify:CR=1 FL=1
MFVARYPRAAQLPRRPADLFQVYRRLAAIDERTQLEADLGVFGWFGHAGALQGGDMDEHVLSAVIERDKAEPLRGVSPFHGASGHGSVLPSEFVGQPCGLSAGREQVDCGVQIVRDGGSRTVWPDRSRPHRPDERQSRHTGSASNTDRSSNGTLYRLHLRTPHCSRTDGTAPCRVGRIDDGGPGKHLCGSEHLPPRHFCAEISADVSIYISAEVTTHLSADPGTYLRVMMITKR